MNKISLLVCLAVISVLLISSSAHAVDGDTLKNKGNEPVSLIVFEGKLFCPLSRPVRMPFSGFFTDVNIVAGQFVEKGTMLAQYDLDGSRAIQLGKEIQFRESDDIRRYLSIEKLKLNGLERNEQELLQLTNESLSPKYLLERLQKELELTQKYVEVLENRLSQLKKFEVRTLDYMRKTIGDSTLKSGDIPDIVKLIAPITGVVLSVHQQLRKESLLPEGTIVAQIGAMDTLLIRSLVYERDVVNMRPGDRVEFFPDSLPERSFPATITSVNWQPAAHAPDLPSYYPVEMVIENSALELRAGFKGRIEYTPRGN